MRALLRGGPILFDAKYCAMMREPAGTTPMSRKNARPNGLRTRIAAAAARIMAEDGIDDFALAKRKAARQLGASDMQALPGNDEIEAELHAYRSLYQADEHPERLQALRESALSGMRLLERFHPYLTGPVLAGTAGQYANIDLQLFPESGKEVEIFLLDLGIPYDCVETRRYTGDRARAVSLLRFEWEGASFNISVFDPRDQRTALKTSVAGRVMVRAAAGEVAALVEAKTGTSRQDRLA